MVEMPLPILLNSKHFHYKPFLDIIPQERDSYFKTPKDNPGFTLTHCKIQYLCASLRLSVNSGKGGLSFSIFLNASYQQRVLNSHLRPDLSEPNVALWGGHVAEQQKTWLGLVPQAQHPLKCFLGYAIVDFKETAIINFGNYQGPHLSSSIEGSVSARAGKGSDYQGFVLK